VQTVERKTSWAKDVWANYFLGDRRLGDNSHFRKDVSPKDGWATKAYAVCIPVSIVISLKLNVITHQS